MLASHFRKSFKSLNYSKLRYIYRSNFYEESGRYRQASCKNYTTSAGKANEEFHNDNFQGRESNYNELYPGHVKTTLFQKTLLAVGSGVTAILDPSRDDMVSAFGETTGYLALKSLQSKMLADPVGRQILEERPVINSKTIDIDYLSQLPDNTFGKQYWKFLSKNGFSPDARRPVQFIDDEDLQYVMLRYRQTHDLCHTLLGMPPHMLGEVIVKMVEMFQTGLPMCTLAALFGPVRLGTVHREKYFKIFLPWAVKTGRNTKFLMAVYFEKHWEDDLQDLRRSLNITDPPPGIGRKKKQEIPIEKGS